MRPNVGQGMDARVARASMTVLVVMVVVVVVVVLVVVVQSNLSSNMWPCGRRQVQNSTPLVEGDKYRTVLAIGSSSSSNSSSSSSSSSGKTVGRRHKNLFECLVRARDLKCLWGRSTLHDLDIYVYVYT